jgi:hypothetical protein
MQEIRSLLLAAGLLASIVTGAVVLPLAQSTTAALAAPPMCCAIHINGQSASC